MSKHQLDNMRHKILYRQIKSVKAGQLERFKIQFSQHAEGDEVVIPPTLWVKIKNTEPVSKRAIYLAGPYILYVDCRLSDYDPNVTYFVTADQPVFEPQLLPGQSFYIQLSCHTLKKDYSWIIDVVSQIIFNNTIAINFEITIGTSKSVLHQTPSIFEEQMSNTDKLGTFCPLLHVTEWDTQDLWNIPVLQPIKSKHLVILTHGLHSNSSVDMLYLKEQIDAIVEPQSQANENEQVVVKSFFGNIGKTERGIKYLGSRVAEYVVKLVTEDKMLNNDQVTKISFIGHSLGGCVQTFAIAYLRSNFPWFFEKIAPINFVTISSPLLGVVNENPLYVKMALSAGFVGKTGQELGLKILENNSKPLLLLLPTGLTHKTLKQFRRRTVYANAVNDGIVPLRTSCLLYLDYKGLASLINSSELENGDKTDKIPKSVDNVNGFSAVQTFLSYFMPQKQNSNEKFKNFQTQEEGENTEKEGKEEEGEEGMAIKKEVDGIPNTTFIDSAASLFLPPMPSMKYIADPSSRENVIVHDKVYYEKDLPPKRREAALNETSGGPSSLLRRKIIQKIDYTNLETIEEDIAREYHKNMSWRKVVVKLKPDAHNNIIVRRRFANAYGWPVIHHLVENHFGQKAREEEEEENQLSRPFSSSLGVCDSLDEDLGLSRLLSRDLMTKENNEIDENTISEEELNLNASWINSNDNAESVFALGVTGLIGEITAMVGDFGNQLYNYSINPPSLPLLGQIPVPYVSSSSRYNEEDDNDNGTLSSGVSRNDKAIEKENTEIDDSSDLGLTKGIIGNFM
ncbi:hypothetical protein KGF56_002441 [Candida oxycetoniae]|uniref:DUF676 domain-containing protein n=1 Tax=Candida oxycetoniae TaxID=497107 RepID=A0AAI9WXZ3_9ASCO|nr:uncharacterized protein KGF56_002441 [Candida oxycetoniae]KAI3404738.2 hypothetical protein KGF56_002441 [Candida oxycetoniae]